MKTRATRTMFLELDLDLGLAPVQDRLAHLHNVATQVEPGALL